MIFLLYTVHILVCLFLVLVVLLQQGKGADLSVFGGGATQAAFGSRGAASLLHKLTVWSFVAFILTTVSISFATSNAGRSSVMSDVPEQTAPAEAAPGEASEEATRPVEAAPVDTQPSGESDDGVQGEQAGSTAAEEGGEEAGEEG